MPKGKENVKYDRLRGKDKHKYEMMFAIRKALEKSNNWNEFKKKLSRLAIQLTAKTTTFLIYQRVNFSRLLKNPRVSR